MAIGNLGTIRAIPLALIFRFMLELGKKAKGLLEVCAFTESAPFFLSPAVFCAFSPQSKHGILTGEEQNNEYLVETIFVPSGS